ncbi:MAG: UTP--glucose-1-phosphate uridylyltransferase GalU [Dehalococcoidia bacterium]|nr:UTP--glucose-1-phosphate uridylyltransferase GalU [Dehalococcoidia bacterium]
MKIRKAIVTAAGWGTRFLPATKAQPKEMLPLVDKPIIQYVVEEAVASGIEQIIIVTAGGKRAIEDHFDRSFELEAALAKKGDLALLDMVKRISELAEICYLRQKEQLGLGHAVLLPKDLIGDEAFAVILPDDIIEADTPCLKQMIDVYDRFRCSVLGAQRVERSQIEKYGIVEPRFVEERVNQVLNVVEKPAPENAPSNLGIVGRYILTPQIFEVLENTPAGKGGEIQLTDGIQRLLQKQAVYAYEFEGTRYDAGTPLGFLKASVEIALKRKDIGAEFRQYLTSVCASTSSNGPGALHEAAAVTGDQS